MSVNVASNMDEVVEEFSDDISAGEEYAGGVYEENEQTHRFKFEKTLKRLLIVCSILLGGELLWLFLITPCMPLSSVDIKTPDGVKRETVLSYSGINSRSSYMSLDAEDIERRLSLIPLVESVTVIKNFPDSVSIILKGRSATAMSLALIDGVSVPVFFDKYGVIFKIGTGRTEASTSEIEEPLITERIPIISGLYFENIKPGTRLPAFLIPLLEDIQNLRDKSPELLSTISEIHVNKKNYDGFDLVLYPAFDNIKIRMRDELTEDNLRYMLLLLDVVDEKGLSSLKEIDFRTGTASYKY